MGTVVGIVFTVLVLLGIGWIVRKSWGMAFGTPPTLPRSPGQEANRLAAEDYYAGRPHVVSARFTRRSSRGPHREMGDAQDVL